MLMVSVCWGWWAEGGVSGGWFQIPQPGKRSEAWLVASCRFPCAGYREYTWLPFVSNILADINTIFPWQGLGLSGVLLITRHPKLYICLFDCIFYSLPPLSFPTSMFVILIAFPLLWENLLSPIQELKTQKLSSSKSCLRLNGRRWIHFSSAQIFQCSVSAPYHCPISCHQQLVRKAWVLTILARFRYQGSEMKQRSLQSVTSKSGWILL